MSSLIIEEKVIALMGDDVDTDIIFPTRFIAEFVEAEVAKHVFEDVDPGFRAKAKPGGIVIAGKNFGCGSAREQAASSLKGAGVKLIIASSFSRSFYRNGINVGLPLIEVEALPEKFAMDGDRLKVDFSGGTIMNLTSGLGVPFTPPDRFVIGIMRAGGIFNFYKQTDGYKKLEGIG